MLLVAGENDERAASMPQLAELAAKAGSKAEQHVLPGRTHTNAVTSRAFNPAAVSFLGS
jgi:hypothetical protein